MKSNVFDITPPLPCCNRTKEPNMPLVVNVLHLEKDVLKTIALFTQEQPTENSDVLSILFSERNKQHLRRTYSM